MICEPSVPLVAGRGLTYQPFLANTPGVSEGSLPTMSIPLTIVEHKELTLLALNTILLLFLTSSSKAVSASDSSVCKVEKHEKTK